MTRAVLLTFLVVLAGLTALAEDHWAFQDIADPEPPHVHSPEWAESPIDLFVLAELERRDLEPTGRADKRTLIRRATFDLIGLPPTPAEVAAFASDTAPDAFSRLVDRLLASPHYGERWGRHWLDVARYADTAGCSSDFPVPQAYRYRNYVINAFNRDKPYDIFLQEQISGDLMPVRDTEQAYERIIATGYLAMTMRFGAAVIDNPRHLMIDDTIDNLGRSILGLNIQCARCHDHKFDPVSTADYYGLYGIFDSTRYPFPGVETLKVQRDFVPLIAKEEYEKLVGPYNAEVSVLEEKRKELTAELQAIEKAIKKARSALEKEGLDAAERARLEARVGEYQEKRGEIFPKWIEAGKVFSETAQAKKPEVDDAYAVADATPVNAKIHVHGDPKNLGDTTPRGFPAVLGGDKVLQGSQSSGRLELGQWLTRSTNPLTSRVMVNRIWQHHFGRGIVDTPNDFGRQGRPPTHPRLLDYLARRFVRSGWSVKTMHRLLMSSATYQLTSTGKSSNESVDPENKYFWRFNRRRLDAESVRDAVLAVSGALDRSVPQSAHPFPDPKAWNFTQHKPFNAVYDRPVRSVYLMVQRQSKHPFFAVFDGANSTTSTGKRTTTTTPIQTLFLMNDPFIHEHSRNFARRLRTERGDDLSRVQRAFELTMGRSPTSTEIAASKIFLERVRGKFAKTSKDRDDRAWASFARAMLRTNEFIYVD